METCKVRNCLKTFLIVSDIQIKNKKRAIKIKDSIKELYDMSKKAKANVEISQLRDEVDLLQGQLDCVRLEILDIVLENPSLISEKTLVKRRCRSVIDFVKQEKDKIEIRGSYKRCTCTIEELFDKVLSSSTYEEDKEDKVTKEDIITAIDKKNVKIMTKYL